MFKSAYSYNDEVVFYFDAIGNKYVAQGGSFSWRINNPGLIKSHCHFARKNGSIGSCKGFAIFSHPEQGRRALSDLLHAKKYYKSTLKAMAKLYYPKDPDGYFLQLVALLTISLDKKICSFSQQEFDRLILSIEKLCGYALVGNESFTLLPRIYAHIENRNPPYDTYLIADNLILSKEEVIEWISTHRLDGVIVHHGDDIHIRSRPSHSMWNIHMPADILPPMEGEIDTLMRIIGEKKKGQCIWGFINGIWNAKEGALESANLISALANGGQVFSMPNDTLGKGADLAVCAVLKIHIDTPVVQLSAKFFRYLLSLSEQDNLNLPVLVFAHSMGAIISEHALELLKYEERQRIRIFTFGGGSFIAPGKCHPDSHNFASAKDLICLLGSPYLRTLAMQRHLALKEGLTQEQIIHRWAQEDARLYLDSIDAVVIQKYEKQRSEHFKAQLENISNVTILDSGPHYEHSFCNDCYQKVVKTIIEQYKPKPPLSTSSCTESITYATV